MIPKGLFTQITMVIIAVAIIMTYVQPAFVEIGEVQNSIEVYKQEKEQVVSVNSQLSSLVTQLESVSNNDQRKLLVYLPDTIDDIAIARDLLIISQQSGVLYRGVSYEAGDKQRNSNRNADSGSGNMPQAHTFSLSVEGTYSQIKNLFSLLEQNHYPLEVHGLSVTQLEGNFLSVDIQLVTYTYQPEANNG